MKQNYLIVGHGKLGYMLALELERRGHDVVVVDKNANALKKLERAGFGGDMFSGVPIDTAVLDLAGIDGRDCVAAVTDDDNTNIMVSQIAKEFYNIEHVVTRVRDPEREQVYEEFGLKTICPTNLAYSAFLDALTSFEQTEIVTVGINSFVFIQRPTDSSTVGKKLSEISVKKGEMVFGIIRADKKMEFLQVGVKQIVREGDILVIAQQVD